MAEKVAGSLTPFTIKRLGIHGQQKLLFNSYVIIPQMMGFRVIHYQDGKDIRSYKIVYSPPCWNADAINKWILRTVGDLNSLHKDMLISSCNPTAMFFDDDDNNDVLFLLYTYLLNSHKGSITHAKRELLKHFNISEPLFPMYFNSYIVPSICSMYESDDDDGESDSNIISG